MIEKERIESVKGRAQQSAWLFDKFRSLTWILDELDLSIEVHSVAVVRYRNQYSPLFPLPQCHLNVVDDQNNR